jgi:integrase
MKAHIRERSAGHFAIVVDVPDPVTGKRRRKWHSFKGTKRGAQIEAAKIVSALKDGSYLEPSKTTLAAYLDKWLGHVKAQVTPKTHERYSQIVKNNVVPALGATVLTKLKPAAIAAAYANALAGGRRDGKEGGLSPRSVGHVHRVLKEALTQAVKWELLHRNPCAAVDPPKVEWKSMATYDLSQTAEMLDVLRDHPVYIPALLAVLCGLRRGEVCALRWRNVDLAKGQISVTESIEQTKAGLRVKSPKSGKGRTVALSATAVEELRAYRLRRVQDMLQLGLKMSNDDTVVAHADGSGVSPIWLSQHWARAIAKTSLPRLRFHDLRHAHATHLLASGINPKIASERLGHSKVGITLDLYSHVIPGMQEDAAAAVDDALRAAISKRQK